MHLKTQAKGFYALSFHTQINSPLPIFTNPSFFCNLLSTFNSVTLPSFCYICVFLPLYLFKWLLLHNPVFILRDFNIKANDKSSRFLAILEIKIISSTPTKPPNTRLWPGSCQHQQWQHMQKVLCFFKYWLPFYYPFSFCPFTFIPIQN